MLLNNKNTGVPVCPVCGQELHEIYVKRLITSYLVFDRKQNLYIRTQRQHVLDDNVFRCSACKAPITSKELFEMLASISHTPVISEGTIVH